MINPRVFISFAHESVEHREAVRVLADWLIERGIEAITDHPYENRPPELGWQAWMLHNIEDVDVVLVVCTPLLKARYEKREELGIGLGATYEGAIITQAMYDAAQRNTKFFPVLPDGGNYENIPITLRPFYNRHCFPSGNDRILRLITEEVQVPKPRRSFEPRLPGQLVGANDNRLAPRERQVYGRESEIMRVLDFLRSTEAGAVVCAQVTGTGGIGKTEVCKAALKRWLTDAPQQRVFYIDIPDTASADEMVYLIGGALGAENISSFDELRPLLREGVYYLDNLESVAETSKGQQVLRRLLAQLGVRLLASSRVSLPRDLGQPIGIEALPLDPAVQLFRDLWTGAEPLEDSEGLRRFIDKDLGCHALSITLIARLGESYGLSGLIQRWKAKGTALAADTLDAGTRQGSLTVSLALTADSLSAQPGALLLWTLAALFPSGIDEESLSAFEHSASLADHARQRLSRHHVWTQRAGWFGLLPPVARYALDEAMNERGGFSWGKTKSHAFAYFTTLASRADSVISSEKSLMARRHLLDRFSAVIRLLETEAKLAMPQRDLLDALNHSLLDQYQFRAVESRELLKILYSRLSYPANAIKVLGDLEGQLGRPEEARRLYGEALELYQSEQNGLGQANTLRPLGDLEGRLGHPEEARRLYGEALELYQSEQNGLGQANTLQSLGDLEGRLGHPEEARRLYGEALELFRRERDGLGQANTLKSLGDLEKRLGHLEKARRLYGEALELFQREQDGLGQAITLKSLGDLEGQFGRPEEARHLYGEALEFFQREQDGLGQANTLRSLGNLEYASNNMVAALTEYKVALALYAIEQEPMGTAYTWAGVARCYHVANSESARDQALLDAFAASEASGIESLTGYIFSVLVEITGSQEAALAWIECHKI